jgi:hypothetical protein
MIKTKIYSPRKKRIKILTPKQISNIRSVVRENITDVTGCSFAFCYLITEGKKIPPVTAS